MVKFINAFSRSQHKKDDKGRSHQFAKRLAAATRSDQAPGPTLSPSELSPLESTVYKTWWEELDPFNLGTVLDEALHPFLYESGLDQEILGQIVDFYSGDTRYMEEQFYGILRLIAHGQSGRKINRDLVALGAPLAHFNNNAIDYWRRQDDNSNSSNQSTVPLPDAKGHSRNTWWGQSLPSENDNTGITTLITASSQRQQPSSLAFPTTNSHRHSYAGSTLSTPAFVSLTQPPPPLPTANASETHRQAPSWTAMSLGNNMEPTSPNTTLIPPAPTLNRQNDFNWAEHALSLSSGTVTPFHHHPQQQQQQQQGSPDKLCTSPLTTTVNRNIVGHSRSRSVPYASHDLSSSTEFSFDTVTSTQAKQTHSRPVLSTSRSSMDTTTFHRILHQQPQPLDNHWTVDQGQSLLLTQKFTPQVSTSKPTNPFEDDDEHNFGSSDGEDIHQSVGTGEKLDHQSKQPTNMKSPFDDNDEEDESEELIETEPPLTSNLPAKVTPARADPGNLIFSTPSAPMTANQCFNKNNILAPPTPAQSSKPASLRYGRNYPLKRSVSQHSGILGRHQRSFMSQGTFLLATSSTSSSVQFPAAQPRPPSHTDDNTTRLFRHRSTTSSSRK
ncbi:hypothetical protein BCR42DRAFT_447713 [Absidia repens]|uniref:Uncharacterized protein n=1 Tax=Absidia repens TaxID=90262 RepID=A0A1X2IW15_9FUNG|nr:hypothetical protein BCR42DRAFT_447713 [Absidia repens]